MHLSVFSLRLELRSRKALENQYLFHGSVYAFNSFFVPRAFDKRLYDTHDTWFYRYLHGEGEDCIQINDCSCLTVWVGLTACQTQKTKLKLKHLWEQGAPWCFSGALRSLRILRLFCTYFIHRLLLQNQKKRWKASNVFKKTKCGTAK